MSLAELRPHLHSLPDRPDPDPLPDIATTTRLRGLPLPTAAPRASTRTFEVRINSELRDGHLSYSELRPARRDARRDPRLGPRLSPCACERQPRGSRSRRSGRRAPARASTARDCGSCSRPARLARFTWLTSTSMTCGYATASCWPAWATGATCVQAKPPRQRRRRPSRRDRAPRERRPYASRTISPSGATTSASSTRRSSTCRSGR